MLKKRLLYITMFGMLCFGLTGCGQEKQKLESQAVDDTAKELTGEVKIENTSITEYDENFISGTLNFSVELFKQCVESQKESHNNLMISPTSVQSALAIAANGADGETLADLQKLLCSSDTQPEGMPLETLNQNLNLYIRQLIEEESVKLNNGNSVWIRDGMDRITVSEDFLKNIKILDAKAFMAPFDETTADDINAWVNGQTDGMIPSIIEKISGTAAMYIFNAIAFDGKWQEPFTVNDKDIGFVFTAADGQQQIVTGMSGEENIYLEDENATGFVKYYEGGRYAFAALLPKEGMDVSEYVEMLTAGSFQSMLDSKSFVPVKITMPKFKSEYSQLLNEVLCDMGIADAFSDTADFSRMVQINAFEDEALLSGEPSSIGILKIDNVFHETYIELDEGGTKSAAVTEIEMTEAAPMDIQEYKYVCLDRPFVYIIMDMNNNLPVFMGVLNKVE